MAMFEVLAEMVSPVELFARIALAELVHVLEVPDSILQILFAHTWDTLVPSGPGELVSTVSANVGFTRFRRAVMECPLVAC